MKGKKHGTLARKHNNYVRNALTNQSLAMMPFVEKKARELVLVLLENRKFVFDFKEVFLIMRGRVSFIQNKFIDRRIFRDAKVEMLKLYWGKVLSWFVSMAVDLKDRDMKRVGTQMMAIKDHVQTYILR